MRPTKRKEATFTENSHRRHGEDHGIGKILELGGNTNYHYTVSSVLLTTFHPPYSYAPYPLVYSTLYKLMNTTISHTLNIIMRLRQNIYDSQEGLFNGKFCDIKKSSELLHLHCKLEAHERNK